MVVSLDAEKAFNRAEWSDQFHTLNRFGLGEKFIRWIMLHYYNSLSAVLTKGIRSSNFSRPPPPPLLDYLTCKLRSKDLKMTYVAEYGQIMVWLFSSHRTVVISDNHLYFFLFLHVF